MNKQTTATLAMAVFLGLQANAKIWRGDNVPGTAEYI